MAASMQLVTCEGAQKATQEAPFACKSPMVPVTLSAAARSVPQWTGLTTHSSSSVCRTATGSMYHTRGLTVALLSVYLQETHKFESRYLDGLLGPYPQVRSVAGLVALLLVLPLLPPFSVLLVLLLLLLLLLVLLLGGVQASAALARCQCIVLPLGPALRFSCVLRGCCRSRRSISHGHPSMLWTPSLHPPPSSRWMRNPVVTGCPEECTLCGCLVIA